MVVKLHLFALLDSYMFRGASEAVFGLVLSVIFLIAGIYFFRNPERGVMRPRISSIDTSDEAGIERMKQRAIQRNRKGGAVLVIIGCAGIALYLFGLSM